MMKIGIPREIKNNENRVGMTPAGVAALVRAGNDVLVETDAGLGSGFTNEAYTTAGATLAAVDQVWQAEMVIKVKEPLAEEYHYFRPGLIIYTYLHLAANKKLAQALVDGGVTGVAYETMVGKNGGLPLLVPMSQVAGKMSVQLGAEFLEEVHGGKGIVLGGVPGVKRGKVTIIGGGTVGENAAEIAVGLGADVTLLDISATKLAEIDARFAGRVTTLFSNSENIALSVKHADLVIGAVLIPGAAAPTLVTEDMVAAMEPGSVMVDIPIDQGGIFETTTHATTHDDPVYLSHGVLHYAVANIPGAVPRTATDALASATVRFAVEIAAKGLSEAAKNDKTVLTGINTFKGAITNEAVASSLKMPYNEFTSLN